MEGDKAPVFGSVEVSQIRVFTMKQTVNKILHSGGGFINWLPRLKEKSEELERRINELNNAKSGIDKAIRLLSWED